MQIILISMNRLVVLSSKCLPRNYFFFFFALILNSSGRSHVGSLFSNEEHKRVGP